MAETSLISIVISEQVIAETEYALARKAPQALIYFREAVRLTNILIVRDPSRQDLAAYQDIIRDPTDVPIVVAAMRAEVDFLVTLNRRHFIDDPQVAARSGLRIGTAGDALAWVRDMLNKPT